MFAAAYTFSVLGFAGNFLLRWAASPSLSVERHKNGHFHVRGENREIALPAPPSLRRSYCSPAGAALLVSFPCGTLLLPSLSISARHAKTVWSLLHSISSRQQCARSPLAWLCTLQHPARLFPAPCSLLPIPSPVFVFPLSPSSPLPLSFRNLPLSPSPL